MLNSLLLDFLIGSLIFVIIDRLYPSSDAAYAAPITIYGGSALIGSSQVSLGFLFVYGFIIFMMRLLSGAGFIVLRNWLYSEATLMEIMSIFLIPNLILFISVAIHPTV